MNPGSESMILAPSLSRWVWFVLSIVITLFFVDVLFVVLISGGIDVLLVQLASGVFCSLFLKILVESSLIPLSLWWSNGTLYCWLGFPERLHRINRVIWYLSDKRNIRLDWNDRPQILYGKMVVTVHCDLYYIIP